MNLFNTFLAWIFTINAYQLLDAPPNKFEPLPVIIDYSPTSGTEGTPVTINGANFTGTLEVKFGDVPASFTFLSDKQLSAAVPKGAVTGPLQVRTPAGTAISQAQFQVILPPQPPFISDFSPVSGAEGTQVTINGANFTGILEVKVGTLPASYTLISDRELLAVVPNGAASGPIEVATSSGRAISSIAFQVKTVVPPAQITAISRETANPGERLIVTGERLDLAQGFSIAGLLIKFNLEPDGTLSFVVPDIPLDGKLAIIVSDLLIESMVRFRTTQPDLPPVLEFIHPDEGVPGEWIVLRGHNLLGTSSVLFGQVQSPEIAVSANVVSAKAPPGSGPVSVTISGLNGSSTLPAAFRYKVPIAAPVITAIRPETGGPGTLVEIAGENLSGIRRLLFGADESAFKLLNPNLLQATVPERAVSGTISLEIDGQTISSPGLFTVPAPVRLPLIHAIEPAGALPNQPVVVRGAGLANATAVRIGEQSVPVTVISDSLVEFTIPTGANSGPLNITTDGGSANSDISLVVVGSRTVPPAAPQILPRVNDSGIGMRFNAEANVPYRIETTTNLASAAWRHAGGVPAQPQGTAVAFSEYVSAQVASAQFYRVLADAGEFNNWSFERGLEGWNCVGDFCEDQPTFGEAYLREQIGAAQIIDNVGGDYWNTRVHLGHRGQYWIGTGQQHPAATSSPVEDPAALLTLDSRTGTIFSPDFIIRRSYISFLIGGVTRTRGSDVPRVEVQVRPASAQEANEWRDSGYTRTFDGYYILQTKSVLGENRERFRREWVSVGSYREHRARIVLVDEDPEGHLNADDFQFLNEIRTEDLIRAPAGPSFVYLDSDAPVWGFADTHTHPGASIGFGGKLIAGASWDRSATASTLLRSCEYAHGVNGANMCATLLCAPELLMAIFAGAGGHRTGGYEYGFDGWPNVLEQGVHQQMYIEWIRRAWQGGLRLMVALAVNNQLLGDLNFHDDNPTDDLTVVRAQLAFIRNMVSANSDFMELALSPRRAREIIHAGKLAIVLGIEVDKLFLARDAQSISDENIRTAVRNAYVNDGVRHVFPVHFADNPYGGFAMYNSLWIYNSWWVGGQRYPAAESAPAGSLIEWEFEAQGILQLGGFLLGVAAFPPAPSNYPRPGGQVNFTGLLPSGRTLIRELMTYGMIIDIDHMSLRTKDAALTEMLPFNYPSISGHSGFTELALTGNPSAPASERTASMEKRGAESDLTPHIVRRLTQAGGMCSPITLAKDLKAWGTKVPNNAPGTSRAWAQTYLCAVEKFSGTNVALATDFGLVHGAAPRFGLKAMFVLGGDSQREHLRPGFIAAQNNGVRYEDPLRDYRGTRFEGPNEGPVYNGEDKEFWEAIALFRSGVNPDTVEYPRPRNDKIRYLARGMRATTQSELTTALSFGLPLVPGDAPHEIRAGFYVRNGLEPAASDVPRVHELVRRLRPIWGRWLAMDGNNRPMKRCKINCIVEANRNKPYVKEWDINLDGLAHYGLLPDFLQDAKNSGLEREDLRPLFRSAEDYIRLWERCERNRRR